LIAEIVESYKIYLEVKYPAHHKNFVTRYEEHPESARAEAALFSVLRSLCETVKIAEDISTGGADFLCQVEDSEFLVEVTSLGTVSVAKQSGMAHEVPPSGTSGSFGMITHMLRTKASSKAAQLSDAPIPRVLAIATEHQGGNALLGPIAAEFLLTSDSMIKVPITNSVNDIGLVTDLKDSVFFRFKNGGVESCRRSISAILLVNITYDRCFSVGILHPDPVHSFPIKLMPTVPFVRLKKWPPKDNEVGTEWIVEHPKSAEFLYHPIKIRDEELRTI